jgi:hypothetical protein
MLAHLAEFEQEGSVMLGIALVDMEQGLGKVLKRIDAAFEHPERLIFSNTISQPLKYHVRFTSPQRIKYDYTRPADGRNAHTKSAR